MCERNKSKENTVAILVILWALTPLYSPCAAIYRVFRSLVSIHWPVYSLLSVKRQPKCSHVFLELVARASKLLLLSRAKIPSVGCLCPQVYKNDTEMSSWKYILGMLSLCLEVVLVDQKVWASIHFDEHFLFGVVWMKNVPHSLRYLDAWSVGGIV